MGQLDRNPPASFLSSQKPRKRKRSFMESEENLRKSTKENMGIENLCQEIFQEIVIRVPLKSRTKLKSVSKKWRTSITSLRHTIPLTTNSGLLIFLTQINNNPFLHSSIFLEIRDKTLPPTASVHSSSLHSFRYLIDSCNGLLLFGTHDTDFWTYHVASYDINSPISLPVSHTVSRLASMGLVFDGSCFDEFKVICFFLNEVDFMAETIQCLVVRSKNWEWRECETRIVNCDLVQEENFVNGHCFKPVVYSRKKLYLLWSLCLMIYDDEKEICKLVQLPKWSKFTTNVNHNLYLYELLWESEEQIHFCAPTGEGEFCIWAYVDSDDEDHGMDYNWEFKKFIRLDVNSILQKIDNIGALNQKTNLKNGWFWKRIQPVAFNEDLQQLYLLVDPGIIASYSFETQRLEIVWSFGEPGDRYFSSSIFPFLFNSGINLLIQNLSGN